jgi:dolichol-phosphate mannosyltransferase
VIPAHNEEGCITTTVEHLHLELRLRNVPHEIVVVDDGSTDATWQKLLSLREHISTVMSVQNQGPHGFGRAVEKGFSFDDGRCRRRDDGRRVRRLPGKPAQKERAA